MPVTLYYYHSSAPSRTVVTVASVLGIELDIVHMEAGDNLKPEFLKLNPQHTIPTIVDDGFSLWESRAIITYLVGQYGKNDSLYPKHLKRRALVDQRLYYDIGTLFPRVVEFYMSPKDPEKLKKVEEAIEFLEKFLDQNMWVAGSNMTVADISILTNMTLLVEVLGIDVSKFSKVSSWMTRAKAAIPKFDEIHGPGLKMSQEYFKQKLAEQQ